MQREHLPVAVIGAGPVGLAAAAHLLEQGQEPIVFEAGPTAGTSILGWAHVRLFSPWRYIVDGAARRLLEPTNWQEPDPEVYPVGRAIVDEYIVPLAGTDALRCRWPAPMHSGTEFDTGTG
jgi:cation diffusion facilitator CzcD-associated flavoprotein CzcO